jgi:hypothetical protein
VAVVGLVSFVNAFVLMFVFGCVSMLWLKVHLTENAAQKEARFSEVEAELGRCRAACARLEQVRYKL